MLLACISLRESQAVVPVSSPVEALEGKTAPRMNLYLGRLERDRNLLSPRLPVHSGTELKCRFRFPDYAPNQVFGGAGDALVVLLPRLRALDLVRKLRREFHTRRLAA